MKIIVKLFVFLYLVDIFVCSLDSPGHIVSLYRSEESRVIYGACDNEPIFHGNYGNEIEKLNETQHNILVVGEEIDETQKGKEVSPGKDNKTKIDDATLRFLSRLMRESNGVFKALKNFKSSGEKVLKQVGEQKEIMVFSGYGGNGFTSGVIAFLLRNAGYNVTVVSLPSSDGTRDEKKHNFQLLLKQLEKANGKEYDPSIKNKLTLLQVPTMSSEPTYSQEAEKMFNQIRQESQKCTLFLEGHMGVGGVSDSPTIYSNFTLSILNEVKETGRGKSISIDSPMMYNDLNGMMSLVKAGEGIFEPMKTYVPDGIIFVNFLPSFLLARTMRFKRMTPVAPQSSGQPTRPVSAKDSKSEEGKGNDGAPSSSNDNNSPPQAIPTNEEGEDRNSPDQTTTPDATTDGKAEKEKNEVEAASGSNNNNSPPQEPPKKEAVKYVLVSTGAWQLDHVDMALVIVDEVHNFMDDGVSQILKAQSEAKIAPRNAISASKGVYDRPLITSGRPVYNSTILKSEGGVLYVRKPLSQFDSPNAPVASVA